MTTTMRRLLFSFFLFLIADMLFAQLPVHSLTEKNELTNTHTFFSHRHEWNEVLTDRDERHAYWKHADGRIMIENSHKPIHYKKDNTWQRIDATCVAMHSGWEAMHQPHPVRIEDTGVFTLDYKQPLAFQVGASCRINETPVSFQCRSAANNRFIGTSNLPGIHKELVATENSTKYNYLFDYAPAHSGAFTIIEETFDFSENIVVKTFPNEGNMRGEMWFGPIHFFTSDDLHVGTIMPALCYDASENWQRNSSHIQGAYSWKIEGTRVWLTTSIDNSWLQSDERIFPVTIDPLVVGPTAAFGDNLMLSCYIPDYNVDSLLVTIPAQVTVTGCFVTASFYADPFAFAVMGDGSMYFSTNCDSSDTFEVQPPTDIQAGTAYLELFDFRDPLLCCFAPSCNEQSFYFRMHLGRYFPEGDCNYSYIYYNPTTLWPFTAFVEGRTVETYGLEWTVSGTPICSSQCTFEGKIRTKYGVPPYTISHPWMAADSVVAQSSPCDLSGTITDLFMQWPGCPEFCPEPFSLDVPVPTITDACGNVVTGLVTETLNIKAAPSISDPSPVQVCSDIPEEVAFQSCAPDYSITWSGNGSSGTGYTIPILASNTDTTSVNIVYQVNTNWNNCPSDTLNLVVEVLPSPIAAFDIAPEPGFQNVPTFFVDESTITVGSLTEWVWTLDGNSIQYGDITSYPIQDLGLHTICLEVISNAGCPDTLCRDFEITTAALDAPNVFTPNGDATNPVLVFDQLQYYPASHLYVYNRWGNLVYEQENYQNNWDGGDLPEGVYYYVLNVEYYGTIASYLQILR